MPKEMLILESARALLIERGFQDVALDDVAKRAGVAKGTLFLYYKGKEELFAAAFADLVDQLGRQLDEVLAGPLRGRPLLEKAVGVILSHFDENRDFMAQFGAGKFPGCGDRSCEKLVRRFSGNLERLASVLRRCAEDGLVARCDFEVTGAFLFGMCRSAMMYGMVTGSKKPAYQSRKRIVELFLEGARKR